MATKTLYFTAATVAPGSGYVSLQVGGAAPAAATAQTGWTVGATAQGNYSLMEVFAERAAGTFGATPLPNAAPNNALGDCYRSETAFTGWFEPGSWAFHIPVLAVSSGFPSGRINARLWYGADPTGSDAVELTTAAIQGATVTYLNTVTEEDSAFTWSQADPLWFDAKYFFIQIAWEITTASVSALSDVRLRAGATAYITTTNFVSAGEWRDHPYHCTGHLFLLKPTAVFQAQVDAATVASGKVSGTSIFKHIYTKNITLGAIADIKEGMTITCGTAALGDDKGTARVRGTTTVSETDVIEVWASPNVHYGELDLATDLYVTVWDDYRVWMKPPYAAGGVYTYDGDRGPQYVTYESLPIANGGPGYAELIADYWKRQYDTQTASLLGYWTLNELAGTTAYDRSGNDYHGTASGVTWGQTGIGDGETAAGFDTGDYINIYSAGLASAFDGAAGTIVLWARANAAAWTDSTANYAISIAVDGNNYVDMIIGGTNNLEWRYKAGGTYDSVSKTTTPTTWLCLAITWDKAADEMKAYYNGAQEGATQTGLGTWSGTPSSTGMNISSSTLSWDGDLAHVALWDVALTPAEISALYNGLITVSFDGSASFAMSRTSVLGAYSADRCTGGTPTASTTTGANVAANAFDDNTGTYWESAGIDVFGETIEYQFASTVPVRRIAITASSTYAPKALIINLSDDSGFSYTTVLRPPNQTAWGANETRYFYPDHPLVADNIQLKISSANGAANIRIEEISVNEEDRTAGTAYTWDVGDGTITVGTVNSEAPTATFPAGFRWVHLTVEDSDGNTGICHIPVVAATNTTVINNFEVITQERDISGQTITFRVHEDIAESTYPDNTLALYWEREVYNGSVCSQSTAGPTGREHMKFIGWIDEEPARIEADESGARAAVELRCVDVGGRLQRLPGFSLVAVRFTISNPTSCFQMDYANIDRMIYTILRWLSTATELADYIPSETYESYNFFEMDTGGGTLYEMVDGRAQTIAHRLTCNKIGQLKVLPDPQLQDSGDRTAIEQESLTEDDYTTIDYTQTRASRYHWLWGSGMDVTWLGYDEYGLTFYGTYFCVAPGETPGQGTSALDQGEQLVQSQAELNAREGHRYALRLNAPQDNFAVTLAHAGDVGIDPAEMTWLKLTLSADIAAQRGLTIADERFLPVRVSISHNHEAQTKTVVVEMEREREGRAAITYTPPA